MVERIKFLLRYAGQGLLDLLFPAVCPHCRQVVTTFEEPICEDCLASLPRTDHAYKRQNEVEELFLKYNEYNEDFDNVITMEEPRLVIK